MDQMTRDNGVRRYGHVLRKDKNNFLRRTLGFKVKGTRKIGRSKKTWLIAVVEQSRKVGLNESDDNSHSKWSIGVNTIYSMR